MTVAAPQGATGLVTPLESTGKGSSPGPGSGGSAGSRELFERLCGQGNDVGIFAEEVDPTTGAALGNFPQAFTHVRLTNAAISLARRLEGEAPMERQVPPRPEESKTEEARV